MDNDIEEFVCPKCKNNMKKGFIQCGNRIAWTPEVSKLSVEPSLNKESIILSKQSRFKINYIKAHICEECKTVVIDYSED